jgi:hypothetical protein
VFRVESWAGLVILVDARLESNVVQVTFCLIGLLAYVRCRLLRQDWNVEQLGGSILGIF